MSIHTWPEKEYAAIDIFMCGHADTRRALDVLIQQLKPTHTFVEHLVRGADPAIRMPFGEAVEQRLTVAHTSTREPPSAQGKTDDLRCFAVALLDFGNTSGETHEPWRPTSSRS